MVRRSTVTTLHHNVCVIHLASSHQVDILSSHIITRGRETTFTKLLLNYIVIIVLLLHRVVIVNFLLCPICKLNFIIGRYIQEKTVYIGFGTIQDFRNSTGGPEMYLPWIRGDYFFILNKPSISMSPLSFQGKYWLLSETSWIQVSNYSPDSTSFCSHSRDKITNSGYTLYF